MQESSKCNGVVAALAGRRIDSPDARTSRFPLSQIRSVEEKIAEVFMQERVRYLISSAACGADLLGIKVAMSFGIRFRIVLPSDPIVFRITSVMDRPGDWGHLYDQAIAAASASADLVVRSEPSLAHEAYYRTNEVIVREAITAVADNCAIAIVVWDGRVYGKNDTTAQFRRLAHAAGMIERVVPTWDG